MKEHIKQHIKQQAREAARRFSYKKLHQRLNHEKPVLRDAAAYELERRDKIAHIEETYTTILDELEILSIATLTPSAVRVKVGVSACVVNISHVPHTFQAWWYDDEYIVFSHDYPSPISADELKDWLDYMSVEDAIKEEPVDAVLDGDRIIIFDTRHEHLIINSDTYQASFARTPFREDWERINIGAET